MLIFGQGWSTPLNAFFFPQNIMLWSQIYTRDTRLPIPLRVMASSAMGLNLGSSCFLPTTQAKAYAKQMRSRFSRAAQHFTCVCPAVHAGNTCTWRTTIILITGKTWRPQIKPHARIKMVHGLVSLLYICGCGRKEY